MATTEADEPFGEAGKDVGVDAGVLGRVVEELKEVETLRGKVGERVCDAMALRRRQRDHALTGDGRHVGEHLEHADRELGRHERVEKVVYGGCIPVTYAEQQDHEHGHALAERIHSRAVGHVRDGEPTEVRGDRVEKGEARLGRGKVGKGRADALVDHLRGEAVVRVRQTLHRKHAVSDLPDDGLFLQPAEPGVCGLERRRVVGTRVKRRKSADAFLRQLLHRRHRDGQGREREGRRAAAGVWGAQKEGKEVDKVAAGWERTDRPRWKEHGETGKGRGGRGGSDPPESQRPGARGKGAARAG